MIKKKDILHWALPKAMLNTLAVIPLIPAIFPKPSKKSAAASPMITPPISPSIGSAVAEIVMFIIHRRVFLDN